MYGLGGDEWQEEEAEQEEGRWVVETQGGGVHSWSNLMYMLMPRQPDHLQHWTLEGRWGSNAKAIIWGQDHYGTGSWGPASGAGQRQRQRQLR
ncbi:hypothetical protein TRIUR3_00950 [Triticum urartu]|uniref:Uncharacterized protein n=1 Tax=Triticum urartu TaxID=4572 RepID=M8A5C6_TRIUA|nr:hypothetical protein TRIUR3_00950 [Triticum urartu]